MKCVACQEVIEGEPFNHDKNLFWCSEECNIETDRIRDLNARSYFNIKHGMTMVSGKETWVDPDTGTAKLHWTTGPMQGILI
jgi:hypothetical protein